MAERLQDRIALVTGASRGIGYATALALAKEGAQVVITARTQEDLDALAKEVKSLGARALPVVADLTQPDDVARLKETVSDEFGRVDILVNNAGVAKYAPLSEITVEDYDWMMNVNMRATFLCTKAFLPWMLERGEGWIVMVGSVAGLNGFPNETVYCASKHAQIGFARALDGEVREKGIKVSVIAPGGVETHLAYGTGRTPGDPNHKNFLEAEAVADAVVYAVLQPPKGRIFLIGMRPMSESL